MPTARQSASTRGPVGSQAGALAVLLDLEVAEIGEVVDDLLPLGRLAPPRARRETSS